MGPFPLDVPAWSGGPDLAVTLFTPESADARESFTKILACGGPRPGAPRANAAERDRDEPWDSEPTAAADAAAIVTPAAAAPHPDDAPGTESEGQLAAEAPAEEDQSAEKAPVASSPRAANQRTPASSPSAGSTDGVQVESPGAGQPDADATAPWPHQAGSALGVVRSLADSPTGTEPPAGPQRPPQKIRADSLAFTERATGLRARVPGKARPLPANGEADTGPLPEVAPSADGSAATDESSHTPATAKKQRDKGTDAVLRDDLLPRGGEVSRAPRVADAAGRGDPVLSSPREPAAESTGRDTQVFDQPASPAEAAGPAPAPREPGHSSAPQSPPRLAHHLLAADGQEPRAFAATDVNQARFVDRVARALRAAHGRTETLRLRLHPPELGSLRIELRMQNGALSARLEAETTAAQSLLIDHAQTLRDRLVEQGVRIERFDVDLLNQQTSRERGQAFEQHASRDSPESRPRAPQSQKPAAVPSELPRTVPAPGRLNVIV
jgi:hypothetical protein